MTESSEYVKEYCRNPKYYCRIVSERSFPYERKVPPMKAVDPITTYIKELPPEKLYELLTAENKAAVNRQIEILLAAQSSDQ